MDGMQRVLMYKHTNGIPMKPDKYLFKSRLHPFTPPVLPEPRPGCWFGNLTLATADQTIMSGILPSAWPFVPGTRQGGRTDPQGEQLVPRSMLVPS